MATRTPTSALLEDLLDRSNLTQAELARRAGLPRSVLNAYLHGHREPGADTLVRIAAAAGYRLQPRRSKPPVDPKRAGRLLEQVLELAEALPYRPRRRLGFPNLAKLSGAPR